MEISQADQTAYLERLGFGVEADGEDLGSTVPPDRHYDVTREVDLIEEVARVHGIDEHLPTTLPAVAGRVGGLSREQRLRRRAEDGLRDLGFDQVVGWSFTDPGEAGAAADRRSTTRAPARSRLSNPLSEEQSAMRTIVLGSLLDVAARNVARGAERRRPVRGRQRLPAAGAAGRRQPRPGSRPVDPLAGVFPGERPAPVAEPHRSRRSRSGRWSRRSWRGGGEPADFFALKGVLEALAGQLGRRARASSPPAEPFLHPGRSAAVAVAGAAAGWLGEVHPLVCRAWDLDAAVAFEIDAAPLLAAASAGEEPYEDVTTFPAVYQDLAVVVPAELAAAEVRAAVLAAGGELLRAAEVFDLYEGEQLGEGRKSLALASSSAPPTAPSPTRRSPPLRERDQGRAGARSGGSLRE